MKQCLPLIFLLLALCSVDLGAQTTKVRGRVVDAHTGEPLPLAGVAFTGTTTGVSTDMEGNYYLESRDSLREVTVTYISYEPQSFQIKARAFNELNIKLVPLEHEIEAIVVTPGENPAHRILRLVSQHKKYNNPDNFPSYHCSTYTKMELDLSNVKDAFKNKKMQKNFGFVFDYLDTMALTGKAYLPVMISETSADYYYRRSPKLVREVISANRISGIEQNAAFAQFTGQQHAKLNFYNNFIEIFQVNFVSPLNDNGTAYYKYYLVDSISDHGRKIYKMRFHPRSKSYPVFDGELSIDSATWALTAASMRLVKGVNVNWIRDMALQTTMELVGDSLWFTKQDRMIADFSLLQKDSTRMTSFIGQRQIDYALQSIGEEPPPEVLKMHNDVVMQGDVMEKDEQYWEDARPYELTKREENIYKMVDSIRNVKMFKNFYDALNMVLFGYLKVGKYLETGPYYKLYSFNDFEGNRIQLGLRTSAGFSKRTRISAFGAYGTKDKNWKGNLEWEYMFKKLPTTSKLTVYARRDAWPLGLGPGAFTTGNIMGSIFARGNTGKMTLENNFGALWEKEWFEGMNNHFGLDYRRMFANSRVDFIRPDGSRMACIDAPELRMGMRFSHNETVMRGHFEKLYRTTDYPILNVELAGGVRNVLGGDFSYMKVGASLRYSVDINPLGRMDLTVAGGAVFGKVPFPLLKLHEGNSTYFYNPYAFSCMNFYEFASDRWGAAFWEHHFNGFFLGKIPLIKKLKWREIVTVKALWGSLSSRNDGSLAGTQAVLLFPEGMSSVHKPYVEAGFGIENIFKIFRIDAIWRVTQREGRSGTDNFAINFAYALKF